MCCKLLTIQPVCVAQDAKRWSGTSRFFSSIAYRGFTVVVGQLGLLAGADVLAWMLLKEFPTLPALWEFFRLSLH